MPELRHNYCVVPNQAIVSCILCPVSCELAARRICKRPSKGHFSLGSRGHESLGCAAMSLPNKDEEYASAFSSALLP
jgi:hypothetical protein